MSMRAAGDDVLHYPLSSGDTSPHNNKIVNFIFKL